MFLDYYNESVDLVVEFFGDFWHANPLMYFPDAVMHDGLTAEDIWERDFKRINLISKTMNPRFLFIVWESNQDRMLEVITDAINHARTVEQICRKA